MSTNLVGDVPREFLDTWIDIIQKYRSNVITLEHLQRFAKLDSTPFAVKAQDAKRDIEKYAAKLARKLSRVFGHRVHIDPLPPEFTDENLASWAGFNMKPVFLPGEDISESRVLKGWTKPERWFYDRVRDGKIKPIHSDLPPTLLRRGWYLADFTVSADYTDGSQVFVNDPLSLIIADLRQKKLVWRYNNTPDGSRFSITPDEWQNVVLAHVASKLGVTRAQTRLERAIEFNAIGNLYDTNRGKFNAWEWFEDHFEDSDRLFGGCRVHGGLFMFNYCWHDNRGSSIAARPLVSFVR